MALLAIRLDAALIFAEGEFARALLDAGPVHAFDEPASGQDGDPLRRWILVPFADPADWLNREHNGRGMRVLLVIPLRVGRADLLHMKVRKRTARLVADAIGFQPDVPLGNVWLLPDVCD